MSDIDAALNDVRKKIDALDLQLQTLLNQRAELALNVKRIKQQHGDHPIYYRPEREAQILKQICDRNTGPLDTQTMTHIFSAILTACLALQEKIKIAFLGPIGTFSQAAALKHFGTAMQAIPTATIQAVFDAVINNNAHYGVVPIVNSTTGIIKLTLDILMTSQVTICGEVMLPIHHCLLRNKNASTSPKYIYSHEQSFAQCKTWLAKNYPAVEKIAVASNAAAAELAADDIEAAAIAGEQAAEIYTLTTVAQHIEDDHHNQTRFLIIGQPILKQE